MIVRVISWEDSVTSGENSQFEVETGWREIIWSESDNLTYLARKLAPGYKRAAMGNFPTFITHYFIRREPPISSLKYALEYECSRCKYCKKGKDFHQNIQFWAFGKNICPSAFTSPVILHLLFWHFDPTSQKYLFLCVFVFCQSSVFWHFARISPTQRARAIPPTWSSSLFGNSQNTYKVALTTLSTKWAPAVYNIKWNQQQLIQSGPQILSTKGSKTI